MFVAITTNENIVILPIDIFILSMLNSAYSSRAKRSEHYKDFSLISLQNNIFQFGSLPCFKI